MTSTADDLDALIRTIRSCFGLLRTIGDDLHTDLDVTAAMRAVLEFIAERDATVPEIARAKLVSRQNIQVRVDGLVAARLVETLDNPAHKRSPLIALTDKGRKTFAKMRRRERAALRTIAEGLAPKAVETTIATLNRLRGQLAALAVEETQETA